MKAISEDGIDCIVLRGDLLTNITTGFITIRAGAGVKVNKIFEDIQLAVSTACHPLLVPLILVEERTQGLCKRIQDIRKEIPIKEPNFDTRYPTNIFKQQISLVSVQKDYLDTKFATAYIRDHAQQWPIHPESMRNEQRYQLAMTNFENRLATISRTLEHIDLFDCWHKEIQSIQDLVCSHI
jgi:hypothetical protein